MGFKYTDRDHGENSRTVLRGYERTLLCGVWVVKGFSMDAKVTKMGVITVVVDTMIFVTSVEVQERGSKG